MIHPTGSAAALAAALAMLAACGPREADVQTAAAPPAWACETREFIIYFDEWEAELTEPALQNIVAQQDSYDGCAIERVLIVGLADATGETAANLDVSRRRAENIAKQLEMGGWPRSVLEIAAVGETGATEAGQPRSMRRAAYVTVMAKPPST